MIRFTVEAVEAGRLDRLLADRFPGVGRRRWAELLAAGEVRLDGRRARKGDRAAAGAVIELREAPAVGDALAPPPEPELPLALLHEDAQLVAIAKPAGQPSHPLRAGERGTAAGAIRARYPECAGASLDPREGGLVHRLDRGTSGVLVAARDRDSWQAVRRAFGAGQVSKRYLALVAGRAGAGECHAALAQRGRRAVLVGDHEAGAQEAETRWRPLAVAGASGPESGGGAGEDEGEAGAGALTLVEVEAITGRMHQVRAHLAAAGHPLLGDPLYGGPVDILRAGRRIAIEHPLLHAAWIALPHPATGARLEIAAPLPPDRRALLEELGLPPEPDRPASRRR